MRLNMKRLNSSGYFLISILLLMGLLSIGAFSCLNGLNSSYILIQRGIEPIHHITDNYNYYQNLKGLIFSVTFLIAATCFLIMVLLPSEQRQQRQRATGAPQPVYQQSQEDSQISAVIEQPESFDKTSIDDDPSSKESVVEPEEIDEIDEFDEVVDDADSGTEEEEDVVYGSGPITTLAIINFVHKFPDSAIKFLYRKQLDGKMLNRSDEDIYREWEQRGMSRGKVKRYVLNMMGWKTFPKKPLYEIWKMLRDHIFDNIEESEED